MPKLEKIERFPQATPATPGAGRTAAAQRAPRCLHVRSNGTRCGSPALAQRDLCYFHNATRDRFRGMPLIEDATSIQVAVMRVLQIINSGACNYKETGLMLYALQIAAQNLRSVREEQALASDIVRYDPRDRDQLRDYQALLVSGELAVDEAEADADGESAAAGFVSGHDLSRAETGTQRTPASAAAAEELSFEGAQLQLRREEAPESPRARESAPSGRTERAPSAALPSDDVVDAAEELSSDDLARALAGAPTEEQRRLDVVREEMRFARAAQRETARQREELKR